MKSGLVLFSFFVCVSNSFAGECPQLERRYTCNGYIGDDIILTSQSKAVAKTEVVAEGNRYTLSYSEDGEAFISFMAKSGEETVFNDTQGLPIENAYRSQCSEGVITVTSMDGQSVMKVQRADPRIYIDVSLTNEFGKKIYHYKCF